MMKNSFLTLMLVYTSFSNAGTTNPFLPLWLQHCNPISATIHEKVDLKSILSAWAQIKHQNLILPESLHHTPVLIHADELPWDQLVHSICQQQNLKMVKQHNLWIIEKQNQPSSWVPLKFTPAHQWMTYQKHLLKQCLKCHMSLDTAHHGLWISAPQDQLLKIRHTIESIDQKPATISIDVTIAEVDQHWLRSWGKHWSLEHTHQPNHFEAMLNAKQAISSALLGHFAQNIVLNQLLSSLHNQHQENLIAQAQLRTNNRETTEIKSGLLIPYQTKDSRNHLQLHFKPVRLSLNIRPILQDQNNIDLEITLIQNRLYHALNEEELPIVQSHQLKTHVQAQNHQLLVLSSLTAQIEHTTHADISPLSALPLVGALFQTDQKKHEQRLLLIFITAHHTGHQAFLDKKACSKAGSKKQTRLKNRDKIRRTL